MVLATLSACGSGGSAPGQSGVSASKPVNSLNNTERQRLCDWYAGRAGGYGSYAPCGYVTVPRSQAECVETISSCAAAVSQFEDCVGRLITAGTACTQASLDEVTESAACQASVGCFSSAGGDGGMASGDAGTGSGIAASRPVNSLTTAERNQVCDWFAGRMGGYGSDPCPGFGLGAPPSQADCLTSFPVCSVTVGQFEPCIERLIQIEPVCTAAAETEAVSSLECQPVAVPCFAF